MIAILLWQLILDDILLLCTKDYSLVVRARWIAIDKNAPRMPVSVATNLILVWTRIHKHFFHRDFLEQSYITSSQAAAFWIPIKQHIK